MIKEELFLQVGNDCFIYFCRILDCKNGRISNEDIKRLNSKIINLYDNHPRNIDECLKQYNSLICEFRFVLQILREKKKIQFLEKHKALITKKNLQGSKKLDFLVDDEKICEITSIKEIAGFYGETGTGMAVTVDSNKANLIGQIEQKLEGKSRRGGASGQIESFLKDNPGKNVNLIIYLPDSCNERFLNSVIKGEEVFERILYSNGKTKWQIRKKTTVNKKGRIEIQPLSNLINKYYDRVEFIFVLNQHIFHIMKKDGTLYLKESKNINSLLI